jgi:hypothetical protein
MFLVGQLDGGKPLSVQYPTLFSHVQNPNITVSDLFTENGWQVRVRYLTSQRAERELLELLDRLDSISLNEEDERSMGFGPDKKFSVKSCYYAMNFGGTICTGNSEVWSSWAPKKMQDFRLVSSP